MHLVFIQYHYDAKIKTPEDYFSGNNDKVQFYLRLQQAGIEKVSIIQRAPFSQKMASDGITYYFINDEYKPRLRWCDKPVKVHTTAAGIEPDLIHVYGLNLPLHFRWLRKTVGKNVFLIGQHTGENIWLQRILWLQQFGLRVVDGFIFENQQQAKPYFKAAVILPRQSLSKIPGINKYAKKSANRLVRIYKEIYFFVFFVCFVGKTFLLIF
jgi:hypothetical protein